MGAEHGLDRRGVGAAARVAGAMDVELVRDPARLGALLELADVLLAAARVHRHHRHQAPAGDEAHEQEPPLEFRHVAGRIGRAAERTLPGG
jgi:hypothetical protein